MTYILDSHIISIISSTSSSLRIFGTIAAGAISTSITLSSGLYPGVVGIPIGVAIVLIGTVAAWSYAEEPAEESKAYWLFIHNPEALRADLNSVVGYDGNSKIPFVWSLLMKSVKVDVLLGILFC